MGTINAGEPGGTAILSEDFNSLAEGAVAGQGQWTTYPKAYQNTMSPDVVLIKNNDEATSLALSGPVEIGEFELSAALRPLDQPLDGTETLVIEFDVLRRTGDFVQVGFAKGNTVLTGFDIAGGTFIIRGKNLEVVATSVPVAGEEALVLKYGNWYRVRARWNGEKGTIRVEYKDLSEGEESFQTAYFDTDRKIPDHKLDTQGLEGADALFVRMPSAQSYQTSLSTHPASKPSVLDNISVSKE